MPKPTRQIRICYGLLAEDAQEIPSKTRYRIFSLTGDRYYLVGKAGGLRVNNKPTISGSIGLTGTTRGDARIEQLIKKGEEYMQASKIKNRSK